MFTSSVMWSVIWSSFCNTLIIFTMTAFMPTYFKVTLRMDLKSVKVF
jgi:hypothetical protein